jgi:hypothetical protein
VAEARPLGYHNDTSLSEEVQKFPCNRLTLLASLRARLKRTQLEVRLAMSRAGWDKRRIPQSENGRAGPVGLGR